MRPIEVRNRRIPPKATPPKATPAEPKGPGRGELAALRTRGVRDLVASGWSTEDLSILFGCTVRSIDRHRVIVRGEAAAGRAKIEAEGRRLAEAMKVR